jgi:hypothetical protein
LSYRWGGKHALARLLQLFVAPSLTDLALQMNLALNRQQLDSKQLPWDQFWRAGEKQFNDRTWIIKSPLRHWADFSDIDPNHECNFGAGQDALITHFKEFRAKVGVAYDNYCLSGQNDPDNFDNFTQGNTMLTYAFRVIEGDLTKRAPLFTAVLDHSIATDTSSSSSSSAQALAVSSPLTRPRAGKRKCASGSSGTSTLEEEELLLVREQHIETLKDVLINRIATLSKLLQEHASSTFLHQLFTEELESAVAQLRADRQISSKKVRWPYYVCSSSVTAEGRSR